MGYMSWADFNDLTLDELFELAPLVVDVEDRIGKGVRNGRV